MAFILPYNQSKSQRQGNYHPRWESPPKTKRGPKELKPAHKTKTRCVMYGYDGYGSIAKTQGKQDLPPPPLEPTRPTAQEKQSPNSLIFGKDPDLAFDTIRLPAYGVPFSLAHTPSISLPHASFSSCACKSLARLRAKPHPAHTERYFSFLQGKCSPINAHTRTTPT